MLATSWQLAVLVRGPDQAPPLGRILDTTRYVAARVGHIRIPG